MRPLPAAPLWIRACPRCGGPVAPEGTDVAVFVACPVCKLEWAESTALDFRTD